MTSIIPADKIKLSNNAVVLVEENHSTPIVALCAYFSGGIRNENKSKNGITNFMQKAALKGTEKYSAEAFAFKSEAIGISFNSFVEKDSFGFYGSVLSKHFDEALDLFFELLFHPLFKPEEVEKERQVILSEIEESRDEIYSYSLELCQQALFAKHPYQFTVKGEPPVVSGISPADLAAWHQAWCQPNNLIFSVVGDISAERVTEKAVAYLEKLAARALTKVTVPREDHFEKREIVRESVKRQAAVAVGFLAPTAESDDRFPFEVLNGLLSGMGARLFIELRDKKGLGYSVGARYDAVLDYGIFKTFIGTSAGQEKAAKEGLIEEVFRLRDEAPSVEELERTKAHLIGLYEIGRQKNFTRALRYARYEMLGLGWRVANTYPKKIEAVQAEMIPELARKYLLPNYSTAIVRPQK